MAFKVTSGWTGSSIFRLAMVDIPIQSLTSITVRQLYKVIAEVTEVTHGTSYNPRVCIVCSLPTPTTPSVT